MGMDMGTGAAVDMEVRISSLLRREIGGSGCWSAARVVCWNEDAAVWLWA